MKSINLTEEKAWITFLHDENWETKGFEQIWFPVEVNGVHLNWDSNLIMDVCRSTFSGKSWGIAPTSQMIMNNACRDNF